MVSEEYAVEFFEKAGALNTDDHIVGTSGLHMTDYVDKEMVYPHVRETSEFCREIARHVESQTEVIVGIGNATLAQWTAFHLGQLFSDGWKVVAIHVKKDEETSGFRFKEAYLNLIRGKRVLVMEDILTTGGTAKKVVRLVRAFGGTVIGVGALWNRGGVTAEMLGVPKVYAVINVTLPSWTEEECARIGPCSRSILVNPTIGHGREFLARQKK